MSRDPSPQEVAARLAAASQAAQGVQGPPRTSDTRLLDQHWAIAPAATQIFPGRPCLLIHAGDGTHDIVYPFRDVLHFAEFRKNCEELAEAFRQRQEAGLENGQPSDSIPPDMPDEGRDPGIPEA